MPKRKPNGSGTMYQRKDGRWEVAVSITNSDGTRKRKHVYARTHEDALQKYSRLLEEADRGIPTKDWRLGDYLDYWLEYYVKLNKNPRTYEQYEAAARLYLKPALGTRRLSHLSVVMLQAYFNGLRATGKVSVRKLQIIRTTLSAALTRAMREELLVRNVARLVELPQWEPKFREPWNRQEMTTFLQAARTDRLFPAFVLLACLGLRRGEVLGLRWRDVDLERSEIHIRQQLQVEHGSLVAVPLKTRASIRDLPLSPWLSSVLGRHQEAQAAAQKALGRGWRGKQGSNELVFTSSVGTPLQQKALSYKLHRICRHQNIRPIRVHDFRHFFATHLKDAGVPARDAQLLLGHATPWTTSQIYQHDDMASRRVQIRKLDGLLVDDPGEQRRAFTSAS